ncbi:uncharacterized protein N7515_008068 [Penicillium bovifimosum]|uniref:F-box domain-containing protein n=1 Tax=Penicillium bovifimosum TaxID=126998 RepID=A0A9W9GMI8_9EURO|nr:uncharacterized protein N7515_008068 [Penicillium bovifimosum]KAJ5124243.1 hypothetical protein N7515_008068 [Penicillium bovifimosum]
MGNLQELPIELVQHILSLIPNNCCIQEDEMDYDPGTEHLYNVCLVSRKLREITQPVLFRNFIDDHALCGRIHTIRITKAIYEHPELGEHVRNITIVPQPVNPNYPVRPISKDHLEFYKGIIKDLKLRDMEKPWLRAVERQEIGVFAALLVSKTPNLRHLRMSACQHYVKPFPYFFGRDPSFMSNVTSIYLQPDHEQVGFNMAHYHQILSLPKLKSMVINHGVSLDMSFPSSWTRGSLVAQEIHFIECHLDIGALRQFMRACKGPKIFTYIKYDVPPFERPFLNLYQSAPEFTAAQVTQEALRHKDTIEVFRVEFPTDRDPYEDVEEYNSTLVKYGSFAGFSVLKVLSVSHAYLPAHPRLPASLETLYISNCNCSIWEMAQNIAADCKKDMYPKLRDVYVSALDITAPIKLPGQIIPEGKTPVQCLMDIQDLFKETTVRFNIMPYRLPPRGPWFDDEEDEDYDDFDDYGDSGDFDYEDDLPPGLPIDVAMGIVPPAMTAGLLDTLTMDPSYLYGTPYDDDLGID